MAHRALVVDEILREVTAHVIDTHPPTAVSLARCAKFFEEPALSALWKIQNELWILIKTLPPDSWDLRPTIPSTALVTITFTRTPSEDEWDRFKRYASWTRVLGPTDLVTISNDVFQELSSATSGGPVCPQLQRLTWSDAWGWEPMRQFLSPYLVSVVFSGDYGKKINDLGLIPTISILDTTYLEKLRLDIPPPSIPIHFALSGVIKRLNPCFKKLMTASSLSEAAWEHLASLPRLESFGVYGTPHSDISKSIPHGRAFPALRRLKIKVEDVRQRWSLLFSLLESSPLQTVAVTISRRIQGADVPGQVITAMLGAELQRSVDDLNFFGLGPDNLGFMSHLGPFSSLKTLKCDTRCPGFGQCVSPLTDSDIEQLASRLPQLVTLSLGHKCRFSHHHTTIKSLISLSTHCPSLDSLHLRCNLTDISEDAKMESGVPHPRLEVLSRCKLRFLDFRWIVMPRPGDIEGLRIKDSALRHLFPLL